MAARGEQHPMNKNEAALDDPSRADSARVQERAALKHAFMGMAGAATEWYDFLLYATAAALVFPTLFFSATLSPFVALLASFSTFAVGFISRPIGGVLFGHYGDKLGRKKAFAAALVLMGTATTLIGLIPPYRTIGVFAPIALIVLRLVQGLAVGGQWGGAILLATENVSQSKRGLYGSIAQAGLPVGVIVANLAMLVATGATSAAGFMDYGWRIPFLFSMLIIGLGLFVHFRVEDTAAFRQSQPTGAQGATPSRVGPSPIILAFRLHSRAIFLAAGANIAGMLTFYILITYVIAFGTSATGLQLPRSTMLTALLAALAFFLPCTLFAGTLSDRIGRHATFMAGVVLSGIWAFVLFPLISTRSSPWIVVAISFGLFFGSLSYGPLAAMLTEIFDTRVRYCAVSLVYQMSAIIGGALAPVIATSLYVRYHSNLAISVYMAGAAALSLVCAIMLKRTCESDLQRHAAPAIAVP